jgi:predicted murein hydrolase (TIGR00659 family)
MAAIAYISIFATLFIYFIMRFLYKKFSSPILVPTATTTLCIVMLLLMFHIDYEAYMDGVKWINELLGPAVVALAYPLYHHRKLLKMYLQPILIGVTVGSISGTLSSIWLAKMWEIEEEVIRSLAPKSVTSPVAMDIAELLNGSSSLAAVYVMIAGITGAMVGPFMLKKCGIWHPIATGVALGSASHGIGTATALDLGAKEAAISSISMTLSALAAVLVCPLFIAWLL